MASPSPLPVSDAPWIESVGSAALFNAGVSVFVAFLTTVGFNYFLAPWLEARKAWMGRQYEQADELARRVANLGSSLRAVQYTLPGEDSFISPEAAAHLEPHDVRIPLLLKPKRILRLYADIADWGSRVISRSSFGDHTEQNVADARDLVAFAVSLHDSLLPAGWIGKRRWSLWRAERIRKKFIARGWKPSSITRVRHLDAS